MTSRKLDYLVHQIGIKRQILVKLNMKKLIIIAVILLGCYTAYWALFYNNPDEKNPDCVGKSRWDVKILTDIEATTINYNPFVTTIERLIYIEPKTKVKKNTPRFGIEFNAFSIQCRIKEYKLSDDGDLHLVLMDASNPEWTMVGEIPDPYCSSVMKSPKINEIIKARSDFKNTPLFKEQIDTSIYIITGVAFYDKDHGQLGAAPTAIEIHPILSIKKK